MRKTGIHIEEHLEICPARSVVVFFLIVVVG
jgi:hypothetical protein